MVLLSNDGTLPVTGPGTPRLAVVGPLADDPTSMLGCYSFPSHVGRHYPDVPLGVRIATTLEALRAEFPAATIEHVAGCAVTGDDAAGLPAAVSAATRSDVCIAVLGDQAGLFGRGTSGEGCDAEDLRLPGVQGRLLDALLDTGTPVVLVLMTGRPYALGRYTGRAAAIVQAFFPGEEGAGAVAGVLSGRINPSGRLPVGIPCSPGGQPATYRGWPLSQRSTVSSIDPSPLYPFGHGLSYTTFRWEDIQCPAVRFLPTEPSGSAHGPERGRAPRHRDRPAPPARPGGAGDPADRPAHRIRAGAARAGRQRRVEFTVHTDLTSFIGRGGEQFVEPG